VHHHQKLCELRFKLESAVREFGAWCLPFPGRGSAIREIVGWFDKEIKSLLNTFVKANKNFMCYAVVCVLRMLYDSGCDHMAEVQDLMTSCDATILEDLPPELLKLACRLVKKCWTVRVLPSAARRLRKDPEVNYSSTSAAFSCYCAFGLYLFGFSMQSDGDEGKGNGGTMTSPKVLVRAKVPPLHMTMRTLPPISPRGMGMLPKGTKIVRVTSIAKGNRDGEV
jgi:hypothetical protein